MEYKSRFSNGDVMLTYFDRNVGAGIQHVHPVVLGFLFLKEE